MRRIETLCAAISVIVAALLVAWCVAQDATFDTERRPNGAVNTPTASTHDVTLSAAKLGFAVPAVAGAVSTLSFTGGNGSALTLGDFRNRVVLLNVWATWCSPCRKEMPTLDRVQRKLGGGGFEVVALSVDQAGIRAVKDFYSEIGIENLRIYVDPTAQAMTTLNLIGLPTTLLIDGEGREVARVVGTKEWDSPEMVQWLRGLIVKDDDGG